MINMSSTECSDNQPQNSAEHSVKDMFIMSKI